MSTTPNTPAAEITEITEIPEIPEFTEFIGFTEESLMQWFVNIQTVDDPINWNEVTQLLMNNTTTYNIVVSDINDRFGPRSFSNNTITYIDMEAFPISIQDYSPYAVLYENYGIKFRTERRLPSETVEEAQNRIFGVELVITRGGSATQCPSACAICLETPQDAVTLNCGHVFCKVCACEWYKCNQSCAMCRRVTVSAHAPNATGHVLRVAM
jgi:hypothetical protein